MYAYFIGKITYTDNNQVILENNGIGYNIIMPTSDIMTLLPGDEAKIYTHTSVREDAFLLYGFLTKEELDFFRLLLSVNGVGPKAAVGILSNSSIEDIQIAIIAGDTKLISKVPGIGAKTAGRIVLELKDKVKTEDLLDIAIANASTTNKVSADTGIKKEATEILGALGYSASESMRALNKISITDDMKVEDLVSGALKLL